MNAPVAPWFGCMLTALIGCDLASCSAAKVIFGMAFGVSLAICIGRIAQNWQDA